MRKAQHAGLGDKAEAYAMKVQELDVDDPEALIALAQAIAERSQSGDLDFDQQMDRANQYATRAIQTIDTDVVPPAAAPACSPARADIVHGRHGPRSRTP